MKLTRDEQEAVLGTFTTTLDHQLHRKNVVELRQREDDIITYLRPA